MRVENQTVPATRDRPEGWRGTFRILLTGMAMGAADIVPGVSGGTIAFVAGIYAQLLRSIKQVTGTTLRLLLRGRFAEAIASVPFGFLLPLGIGIVVAAFSLANLISWLLSNHPVYVWAFFMGLVGASVVLVLKRTRRWTALGIGVFLAAAALAYLVTGITTVNTPETPVAFFLAGTIAICAMVLPGLSGSFLLIIMGKYDQVLDAVVARDVLTLLPFFLGAAVGISLFSRALTWLLARHHDLVIVLLAGLMLGSLPRIWPWKEEGAQAGGEHAQELSVQQANILPDSLSPEVLFAIALMVVGAVLIAGVDSVRRNSVDEDYE